MTKKPYIPVILGTARSERRSEQVARFVYGILRTFPITTRLIDVKDLVVAPHTIPPWQTGSREATTWRKIAKKADGFIIVTPEYNHSFSGELKLLLDMAFKEYERKPVGLVGVSDGQYGGARMVEHLQPVLANFRLIHVPAPVLVSNVDLWAKNPKEQQAVYQDKIVRLIETLHTYL